MRKQKRIWICNLAVLFLLLPVLLWAADFTVTPSSDSDCADGDCDLQSALTAAAGNGADDTIEIAPGTYVATTTFEYDDAENHALVINGSGRDTTILSGNDTAPVLRLRNSGGADADFTITNITISNGYEDTLDGGGLLIEIGDGDVTLEYCIFRDNQAYRYGGGAYIGYGGGLATINNCIFDGNQASDGAGLHLSYAGADFQDSNFTGNTLGDGGKGGGAYITTTNGPITIGSEAGTTSNYFTGNTGGTDCQGGGLYVNSPGFDGVTIIGNVFSTNALGAGSSGGGAYLFSASGPYNLNGNIFCGNLIETTSGDSSGGGLRVIMYSSMAEFSAVNNFFCENQAISGGGAYIESEMAGVDFINNTSTENNTTNGAGIYLEVAGMMGNVNVYNNILWGENIADDLYLEDYNGFGASVHLKHNNIESWGKTDDVTVISSGNVDPPVDPQLTAGSSVLPSGSPMIDQGLNQDPANLGFEIPDVDIQGDARPLDGGIGSAIVDIGADEYSATPNQPPSAPELVWPPDNAVICTGSFPIPLSWNASTDPEGHTVTYDVFACPDDPTFAAPCDVPVNASPIALNSRPVSMSWAFSLIGIQIVILGIARLLTRKKNNRGFTILLMCLVLLNSGFYMVLPGCDTGPSGGSGDDDGPIDRPIADAGPDQFVKVGAIVQLDGSGSRPLVTSMTYAWDFETVPDGSAATISDSNVVNPTFVADLAGSYEVNLEVTVDDESDLDSVQITAGDCLDASDAVAGDRSHSYTPGTPSLSGYYWKVRATDELGATRESVVASFSYEQ